MPRVARKKAPDKIHHIMSRSISEINFFKDNEDKNKYLHLIKISAQKHACIILGYCLMDNHVHIQIDPAGGDISKFMASLNTAYVNYYNKKYNRRGPLMQGRFANRIVETDRYSLALSAYIHNNPKDIIGYNGKEEYYPYSSYGIYLGFMKDKFKLINVKYILNYFSKKTRIARKMYYDFVKGLTKVTSINEAEIQAAKFEEAENEYNEEYFYTNQRQILCRDYSPEHIIIQVAKVCAIKHILVLQDKYSRVSSNVRAVCTYCLRVLCNLSYVNICKYIRNMSLSGISSLCNKGRKLIFEDDNYQKVLSIFTTLTHKF